MVGQRVQMIRLSFENTAIQIQEKTKVQFFPQEWNANLLETELAPLNTSFHLQLQVAFFPEYSFNSRKRHDNPVRLTL